VNVSYKPSRRFAEYVRKIVCDEWEDLGVRGNDLGVLRHKPSGITVAYALHDGGNEWNGPRNFAADVQKVCGCRLIEPRGRKTSRKSTAVIADPQVEASRRRHATEWEAASQARETERAAEASRRAAAERAESDERRRRDIESLMRKGY